MSKFIFKSFPQLVVVAGLLMSSTQAHASGGPSDPVPQFVNLLILIGIITFVYQSKIKSVLVARAEEIKSELEKGQKELSIAEAHAEEVDKGLQRVGCEDSPQFTVRQKKISQQ